jgi:hypothetical protein
MSRILAAVFVAAHPVCARRLRLHHIQDTTYRQVLGCVRRLAEPSRRGFAPLPLIDTSLPRPADANLQPRA